jgi:2-keto-4-pentenoate hydratase
MDVKRRSQRVLLIDTNIDEIARAFVASRKAASPLLDYPGTMPVDLASAYAIQDAAIAEMGGRVCGWKVGRINAPRDTELGTTRLFGPAWADDLQILDDGGYAEGRIFEGGFGAAEAEFMFRIGTPPDAGTTKLTIEQASELIDTVFIGFEIASSPFPGINGNGPLVTITDFGNNNGLLIGPEIPNWRNAGLADWVVETQIDGQIVGSGCASSFPGGPVESVRLLVENLLSRGHQVTPGMLVSSGAVSGVHAVIAGQTVKSRFGAFGSIECTIGYAGA